MEAVEEIFCSRPQEVDPEDRKPHNSQEARPRKMPSVLTSVIVVRMILEAFAGSVPILRRTMGIVEPKMPLIKQLMAMARNTTALNLNATGLFCIEAKTSLPIPDG